MCSGPDPRPGKACPGCAGFLPSGQPTVPLPVEHVSTTAAGRGGGGGGLYVISAGFLINALPRLR